ncbi:hypothetical protein ACFX12_017255 [Malus domestica]
MKKLPSTFHEQMVPEKQGLGRKTNPSPKGKGLSRQTHNNAARPKPPNTRTPQIRNCRKQPDYMTTDKSMTSQL